MNIATAKRIILEQGYDPYTIDWASYSPQKDIDLQTWLVNEYGIDVKSETEKINTSRGEWQRYKLESQSERTTQPTLNIFNPFKSSTESEFKREPQYKQHEYQGDKITSELTAHELLTMPEEQFKSYSKLQRYKERNEERINRGKVRTETQKLISQKKRQIIERIRQLRLQKQQRTKYAKALNFIRLPIINYKDRLRRLRAYKAVLKPLKNENFTTIGQSSGYFKKKPEQKKTNYLGFI